MVKGENGSRIPCLKGRDLLYTAQVSANFGSFTLQSGLSYMTSGAQRLRKSVHRGWTGLLGHSSGLSDTEVEGAWDGARCCRAW
jgi:hypothetical protein